MNDKSRGGIRNKIMLSAAVIFAVTALMIGYFTLFPEESSGVDVATLPEDRRCELACKSCGEKYDIPLKAYVEQCDARQDKTQGILCEKCGQASAWLGEPPIEYSDRKWKAGWVGRDILKSNLKAYHAANPEPAGEGVGMDY